MTQDWQLQPDGTWRLHGGDLRGKSLDEVMAVASECVDAAIERSLDEFELLVRDHGATERGTRGNPSTPARRGAPHEARVSCACSQGTGRLTHDVYLLKLRRVSVKTAAV